jgi:hypothetical protein
MKRSIRSLFVFSSIAISIAACGGPNNEHEISARLELPASQDSSIAVRPALDVSSLYDPSIADRIVIEEIDLFVADVRLLGSDPRMPVGGLPLLSNGHVIEGFDAETATLELPFPAYLADQEDLAVYIRLDRSEALQHASVVVRGRIYSTARSGGSNGLTAAVDPDGDPADEGEEGAQLTKMPRGKRGTGGVDPDGDPADCVDPDGDPAKCRYSVVERGEEGKSVPFELRGEDVADLITGVDASSLFDVVIGIPAARWFTPEAMVRIESELAEQNREVGQEIGQRRNERDPVVLNQLMDRAESARERMENQEYFAAESDRPLDDLKIRRPERR